jgi:hypothetical protein
LFFRLSQLKRSSGFPAEPHVIRGMSVNPP